MINVYALQGCDKCSKLVNELKVEGISCNIIYDTDNDELFDELEELVDCTNYPIVVVHPNNILEVLDFNGKDTYIIPSECKSKKSNIINYNDVFDIINIIKTIR